MEGVPAILVFILTGWFGVLVYRQFRKSKRQNVGFWMVSLVLSSLASLGYALAAWHAPQSVVWFLVYYLCGAMWMPAIMGLGSLALVFRPRTVWIVFLVVVLLGVVGGVFLLGAPVNLGLLQGLDGGAGTGVIVNRAGWLIPLIVLNTFGAAAVIIVALTTGWRTLRKKTAVSLFRGNLFLAVGVLIISMAGTAARLGAPMFFWITMLVGWIVTFVGYRLLTPSRAEGRPATEAALPQNA